MIIYNDKKHFQKSLTQMNATALTFVNIAMIHKYVHDRIISAMLEN